MALNQFFHAKTRVVGMLVPNTATYAEDNALIRREVRLMRQPNWIATPLFDLIRYGQVQLVQDMPGQRQELCR